MLIETLDEWFSMTGNHDVLDLQVDASGVGEKLIEAESSGDIAHSGLADLIDRIVDVLNHNHRFSGSEI
jgi:hypothetical protein